MLSWRSKGISNESIKPPTTTDNSLSPRLSYYGTKMRVQFTGSCLKQPKFTFTHKKSSKYLHCLWINASSSHISDPTIKKLFIRAVTLPKNADIEKYRYSGYGIGFEEDPAFHFLVKDLATMY